MEEVNNCNFYSTHQILFISVIFTLPILLSHVRGSHECQTEINFNKLTGDKVPTGLLIFLWLFGPFKQLCSQTR